MGRTAFKIMASASVLLLVAGCGGGGDNSGGREAESLTKTEFIAQADAICARTDQKQEEARVAFIKRYPEADTSDVWEEKLGVIAGLIPVQAETRELAGLPLPNGDQGDVAEIIDGIEQFVKKGQEDPSIMLTKRAVEPMAKVEKLAKAYGFKACALPL